MVTNRSASAQVAGVSKPGGAPGIPVAGISAAEMRFERVRRTAGLFIGPLAFALVWLLPLPGVSLEAHRLGAIVSLVVVWWVTEAIPIPATALIGAVLTVIFGVTTAQAAFAPFASPVIFLFVGSFMIGRAVAEHGLDYRLASSLLSLPMVRGRFQRMRLALAAMCVVFSAWLSNTATTAMIVPVALGLITSSGTSPRTGSHVHTSGFLLTLAYATAVGGMTTPIGSPPNLITIGLLERLVGIRIDFLSWMMVTTPVAIVMGLVLYGVSSLLFPVAQGIGEHQRQTVEHIERRQRRLTPGQRNCVIAFAVAVVLWVTPGVYTLLLGTPESAFGHGLVTRLDEGVVAVLAASLLFLLPINWKERQFTLGWAQASRIDWGTILLFGGGLSLGHQMFETGLAEHIGVSLVAVTGAESLWTVTAAAVALGILLTELTSNTAAANMLVPVVISICHAGGLNPVPPALGAAMGASMAFMLPISTPPNAIVYGTGYVRIGEMMKFGALLDFIGFFIVLAGLRILCPLLGFA